MYYVIGASVSSLHRESTDSLIRMNDSFFLEGYSCIAPYYIQAKGYTYMNGPIFLI